MKQADNMVITTGKVMREGGCEVVMRDEGWEVGRISVGRGKNKGCIGKFGVCRGY